jgi:hypothetical protein
VLNVVVTDQRPDHLRKVTQERARRAGPSCCVVPVLRDKFGKFDDSPNPVRGGSWVQRQDLVVDYCSVGFAGPERDPKCRCAGPMPGVCINGSAR